MMGELLFLLFIFNADSSFDYVEGTLLLLLLLLLFMMFPLLIYKPANGFIMFVEDIELFGLLCVELV